MTLFDDQPSARDVRKQRQARLREDVQHASSAPSPPPPGKPSDDAVSENSPSTPIQWGQQTNELGFLSYKKEAGGQGIGRYIFCYAQDACKARI